MQLVMPGSIVCEKGHCFDLSKSGYLNFLPGTGSTDYTSQLFEARRRVFAAGIYDSLLNALGEVLLPLSDAYTGLRVLDAGCGEGFFASSLSERMNGSTVFGLDIAKYAIQMAAKSYKAVTWLVGDVANLPFLSGSIDVILNILTPANYAEFTRVLSQDGVLIKVIPGAQYLKELRSAAKEDLRRNTYSNVSVVQHLQEHMVCQHSVSVCNVYSLPHGAAQDMSRMTPMLSHMQKPLTADLTHITIDLEVLVCSRK